MFKLTSVPVLVAGGVALFVAGAAASYVLVKPVLDFAETAPLYILSEQTHVLKSLRSGKDKDITAQLEQAVWLQIALHAERSARGKSPPEGLQRDLAYHCGQLGADAQHLLPQETYRLRRSWCAAVHALPAAG